MNELAEDKTTPSFPTQGHILSSPRPQSAKKLVLNLTRFKAVLEMEIIIERRKQPTLLCP